MAYEFPAFNPSLSGKDGESRSINQYSPVLDFPNMNATLTKKDGEGRAGKGTVAKLCAVNKIFIRIQSGEVVEAIATINKNGIKSTLWSVYVAGDSTPAISTLDFPNMNAINSGKDGGSIAQIQAETQATYPWNFDTIWYMGSQYPLLR